MRRFAGFLAALLCLAGCGGAGVTTAAPPQPASGPAATSAAPVAASSGSASRPLRKVSFILDWIPEGYHAAFYLAKADGLFARQGLDVTIVPGKGSGTAVQQVIQGHDDFGFADGGTVMQYRAKGAAVKMVFDMYPQGSSAIMFPKASGLKSPKQLAGRSIALTPGGAAGTLVPVFLQRAGVDAARVKLVAVGSNERDSLLLTHKVAAIASLTVSEYASLLGEGMDTRWFSYSDYGLNLPGSGILATDATIEHHPKLVQAFVDAVAAGMKAAKADPSAAIAAEARLADYPSFNAKYQLVGFQDAIAAWTEPQTAGHPYGWMVPGDWAKGAQILERYMKMKTIDPTTAYTNQFIG